MAGAGVPVPMDDGTAIAAAPEIVCPLCPEWPEVAKKGEDFLQVIRPARFVGTGGGVGNAVAVMSKAVT